MQCQMPGLTLRHVWERQFPFKIIHGNESSREQKVPGNERSREPKFQGMKVPPMEPSFQLPDAIGASLGSSDPQLSLMLINHQGLRIRSCHSYSQTLHWPIINEQIKYNIHSGVVRSSNSVLPFPVVFLQT